MMLIYILDLFWLILRGRQSLQEATNLLGNIDRSI